MTEKEIRKHENMLTNSLRDIICDPTNCGKTNVNKLAGKFTQRTL